MVDSFLRKLKDAIVGPENENPRSSEDEDNYDRPSDAGQFGNVRPASEDPLGDPADQAGSGQFGNVRPASEDPYGDPADEEGFS